MPSMINLKVEESVYSTKHINMRYHKELNDKLRGMKRYCVNSRGNLHFSTLVRTKQMTRIAKQGTH
jgi:hypothetical protein